MKINKTIYAESIELIVLGSPRWRKVGLEADLDEGEDAVKSSIGLKKIVDEVHKQNNADMDFNPFQPTIVKLNPMVARMKILIDSATTKKELDGYRSACPKEMLPELEAKYKKLKK